jgi:hypothetical protein
MTSLNDPRLPPRFWAKVRVCVQHVRPNRSVMALAHRHAYQVLVGVSQTCVSKIVRRELWR